MSPSPRRWRVTVCEWLTHYAVVEAASADEACAKAQRLWKENAEHDVFQFSDSGLDGIHAEEE